MLTKDESETVRRVFQKFASTDNAEPGWSDIDEHMSMLEWLGDAQLVIESSVIWQLHCQGETKCNQSHPSSECFVPTIVEAVGLILRLYEQNFNLHANNRFILNYYLCLTHVGFIVSN